MLPLFALACFLVATTTSATGVGGDADSVAVPEQLQGRELAELGCFKDNADHFFMEPAIILADNTPENCQEACGYEFKYFGLGTEDRCVCGRASEDYSKYGETFTRVCVRTCPHAAPKECGAYHALHVYEVPAPESVHLGCFDHKTMPRGDFERLFTNDDDLTKEKCAKACGSDYKYFGLKKGERCFCGKENADYKMYDTSNACGTPCTGDNTNKQCGGKRGMDIYEMMDY